MPRPTAYRWASDPKVRSAVESIRRRLIDRSVGLMARRATYAVGGITKIAADADSDSVRLKALRAILADMMAVSNYSGLEDRMAEIEEQLRERSGNANRGMSDGRFEPPTSCV